MSDALLWNEIGNIYLKIGSQAEAIAAYTKAIELNPASGWLYCNLGHAYFVAGEFGQALFLFRKSIPLMDSPENQAAVWNKIGDAYRALKDIDNAIQAYRKADDLDMGASPSEKDANSQSANLANLRDMIKREKVVPDAGILPAALPKMIAHGEPSPEIQALVDDLQSDQTGNDYEPALPAGNHPNTPRLVKDEENAPLPRGKPFIVIPDPEGKADTSPCEETSRSTPERARNSPAAVRQDETRAGKSKDHSILCSDIENLEEILAKVNIYENITRVNPTSDRAWDTLGKLYKSLGRYKDAIGAYHKAIDIMPDREVYYYYLGLLYSVEQQHNDAVQAFQLVLRKNPDYILAHSALAGVYHRMGLENKANHHIATALPKMNNESTYNRACFYAICGDTELAFEFLRLALMNKDTTIAWIKSDPDLDPIRTDPRYQELISEQDQPAPKITNENYFSSELEGTRNQLLPILNHSLAR